MKAMIEMYEGKINQHSGKEKNEAGNRFTCHPG